VDALQTVRGIFFDHAEGATERVTRLDTRVLARAISPTSYESFNPAGHAASAIRTLVTSPSSVSVCTQTRTWYARPSRVNVASAWSDFHGTGARDDDGVARLVGELSVSRDPVVSSDGEREATRR
jgi:hypothetical protein